MEGYVAFGQGSDLGSLDETTVFITEAGGEVMTGQLDARNADGHLCVLAEIDARYGARCDVLVNVVGGTFRQPFEESRPKGWDALMRTNFTWVLRSTQLAVTRMRPSGGSIINITSIEGHRAAPGFAVYAAMKAGGTSPHTGRRTCVCEHPGQHRRSRLHRHCGALGTLGWREGIQLAGGGLPEPSTPRRPRIPVRPLRHGRS